MHEVADMSRNGNRSHHKRIATLDGTFLPPGVARHPQWLLGTLFPDTPGAITTPSGRVARAYSRAEGSRIEALRAHLRAEGVPPGPELDWAVSAHLPAIRDELRRLFAQHGC
jgi:hypothetical protein